VRIDEFPLCSVLDQIAQEGAGLRNRICSTRQKDGFSA
jgi:hypothetical protein